MDEQVIAAMARWPDVPAVYGWLSLSESGLWRLHPKGDALQRPESSGEEIASPQILAFMNRNYAADALGQWYFQNGPQRVYVRLDAAPFIAHTTTDAHSGRLKLRTHTGQDIREVQALHLDENGRLFAATDRGAALIAGRDLPALLDSLQPAAGGATAPLPADADIHDALARCLETGTPLLLQSSSVQGFPAQAIPLLSGTQNALEDTLHFRRHPQPPQGSANPSQGPDSPVSG
ncbi:MAG: DUF2946 family protein [Alcaligenaceae bacterium]|nr:DUF2946 family protein [Alcaligenaceae bacterium]